MTQDVSWAQEFGEIEQQALAALQGITEESALQAWRSAYLGRGSRVMQAFTRLGEVPKEQRPAMGQEANRVKQALESALAKKEQALLQQALERSLTEELLDVTLPGRQPHLGRLHISTQTLREIYRVFAEMGFQVYRSREVETDANNFELLNIPAYHPARDMWDTFHTTTPGVVLRTHTSPGQIHAMREFAPQPVRVILPGMCYRYEQSSVRHEIQFNQVEVLAVSLLAT